MQQNAFLLYKALAAVGVSEPQTAGEGTPAVTLSDFLLPKDPFHFNPF